MDQGRFHQVKRINVNAKENTDYKLTRTRGEHRPQWAKYHPLADRDSRRLGYVRKAVPDIRREFRVVRDNRMNQTAMAGIVLGSPQYSPEDDHLITPKIEENSLRGNLIDHKHAAAGDSDGRGNLNGQCDSGSGQTNDGQSTGSANASLPKVKKAAVSNSTGVLPREVQNNARTHSETFAANRIIRSMSIKSAVESQYNFKLCQQLTGRYKGTQPKLMWKPKSTSQVQAIGVSEKLLQVGDMIIPQHLLVAESEHEGLVFGSFGAGFDSTKGFSSDSEAFKNTEPNDEHSASISSSIPVAFDGDSQVRTSRSEDLAYDAEPEHPLPVNAESLIHKDIESYSDIGLIESHGPSFTSIEPQQQKGLPKFSDFSAYEPQTRFDIALAKMMMEDTVQGQGISSAHEAFSSLCIAPIVQQQQAFTQPSSQARISHYTNFVPYRQIFPPMYAPPMSMPNYSNKSTNTQNYNASNYVVTPAQNTPFNGGGLKYAAVEYKPVQAVGPTTGYGTYPNPGGYAASAMGSTAGMQDMATTNNFYVSNSQSDINNELQTPWEISSLQTTHCYSISGQAPQHLPALTQTTCLTPHLQYPGLGVYHPSHVGGSIVGPTTANHVMHHQVQPGFAGAAQVGPYQPQPPRGHLVWPNNL